MDSKNFRVHNDARPRRIDGKLTDESEILKYAMEYIHRHYSKNGRRGRIDVWFELPDKWEDKGKPFDNKPGRPDGIAVLRRGRRRKYEVHVVEAKSSPNTFLRKDTCYQYGSGRRKEDIPTKFVMAHRYHANFNWLVIERKAWNKIRKTWEKSGVDLKQKLKQWTELIRDEDEGICNGIGVLVISRKNRHQSLELSPKYLAGDYTKCYNFSK